MRAAGAASSCLRMRARQHVASVLATACGRLRAMGSAAAAEVAGAAVTVVCEDARLRGAGDFDVEDRPSRARLADPRIVAHPKNVFSGPLAGEVLRWKGVDCEGGLRNRHLSTL